MSTAFIAIVFLLLGYKIGEIKISKFLTKGIRELELRRAEIDKKIDELYTAESCPAKEE